MNKKELLRIFIKTIQDRGLLTSFIKFIFDYDILNDYNYIFRLSTNEEKVIIDIYDNISVNRFNRYIFNYSKVKHQNRVVEIDNVFVTYIDALNLSNDGDKLHKLVYMTTLSKDNIITYANKFLPKEFINILSEIIKKPIE